MNGEEMSLVERRLWEVVKIVIGVVAIVSPWLLLYNSIALQSGRTAEYEKEKLIQLLNHLDGEIKANLQLISDRKIVPEGMMPIIRIADSTEKAVNLRNTDIKVRVEVYVPKVKFKTAIWETANTKDYFFLVSRTCYYNINGIYSLFYDYNDTISEFASNHLRLGELVGKRDLLEAEFLRDYEATEKLVGTARILLDQLTSQDKAIAQTIRGEMDHLSKNQP